MVTGIRKTKMSRRCRALKYTSSSSIFLSSRIMAAALCIFLALSGTARTGYSDGTNGNSNQKNNSHFFVSAIKPIRNLHVTYRGQTYTIREGVSTVDELTERFESLNNNLGNMGNHVSPKGIVWNGQVLKPGEDLSKAGIKNGDRVMILPGDKETKAIDILGIYLFLLSSSEKAIVEAISEMKKSHPEQFEESKESFQSFLHDLKSLDEVTPKQVSAVLRGCFDSTYHRLRSWWEHPSLRQALHDPQKIENYRRVVSTNLSPNFLKRVSSFQKVIESPELWRREFSKISTKLIKFGDTVLEGILDLLLDVLKGKGSSYAAKQQSFSEEGDSRSPSTTTDFAVTNEMKDPSLANNLLFELSDSEDETDLEEL